MTKKLQYLLFLFLLSSCSNLDSGRIVLPNYFDFDSLINNQIKILAQENPKLEKSARLLDQKDEKISTPDSAQWEEELKMFRDANINKPALNNMYKMVKGPGESGNNLKEINYLPVKPNKVQVKYIKIFYVKEVNDIRRVEARIEENNPLFDGVTFLKMNLKEDGKGNLVLDNYIIEGGQKMILSDSVSFAINGKIIQ